MGFLDKAKAVAGQAAGKAKAGVEDLQLKVDLNSAYEKLGKATFPLIESGEVTHPGLEEHAEKIRGLRARIDDEESPTEPVDDAPPPPPEPRPDVPAS